MIILGLASGEHDTSAALLFDGKIVAASAEERFNRMKHTSAFPINAIKFCLNKANISANKIDLVTVGMEWAKRAELRLSLCGLQGPDEYMKEQHETDLNRQMEVSKILKEEINYHGDIKFINHHDSHASCTYFTSPYNEAAVVIIDGAGEISCTRIYKAHSTNLRKLIDIQYPHSLGRFYAWITDYLGFTIDCDEGKVMGLAPFGDLSLIEEMRKVVIDQGNGLYELDLSYFNYSHGNIKAVSEKFIQIFGPKRSKNEEIKSHHKNVARATQFVLEERIIEIINLAKRLTNSNNLCLSGGVILNSVANGKIDKLRIFNSSHSYPASGDDGVSIGSALFTHNNEKKEKTYHSINRNPYLGYESTKDEIKNVISEYRLQYSHPKCIFKSVVSLLAKNNIIAWFSGPAEFGPRALGNRSILADPRVASNKDILNQKIKFRESFRPFAPSVLKEYCNEYFDIPEGVNDPYMLRAFQVLENKQKVIPAVTHIDGSARVHLVDKEINYRFWNLINTFYQETGVPILINTSFNRAKEVLVNTPKQAVETFLGSGLNVLVLEDYIILKSDIHQ